MHLENTFSGKNWNTKELVHDACIARTRKGTPRDKATSNNEEIKPIALSIAELCLAGGIS